MNGHHFLVAALALAAAGHADALPFYGTTTGGAVNVSCLGNRPTSDGAFGDLRNTASIADTMSANCGPTLRPTSSTMQASASTAGMLKAFGSATGDGGTGAGSFAEMANGIRLFAPSGFNGSSVQVTEQLIVSGSASGKYNGNAYLGEGEAVDGFFYAIKEASASFGSSFNPNLTPNFVLSITFDAPVDANGQAYFVLEESIGLGVVPECFGCTSTVDMSHTARAAQILPAGWTFVSDSGDFLVDAAPPPVPEPATFALMALGLAGMTLRWRASPKRQARPALR